VTVTVSICPLGQRQPSARGSEPSLDKCSARSKIKRGVADGDHLVVCSGLRAQPSANAGEDLLETKRLDYVVVGACVETCNGVVKTVTGRQDEDRYPLTACSHLAQDGQPVDDGEADVQDQQIELCPQQRERPIAARKAGQDWRIVLKRDGNVFYRAFAQRMRTVRSKWTGWSVRAPAPTTSSLGAST
jgi:hypothetical protein